MAKVADKGLFSLPPEEHARVRRLVSAAFTPRAIARMDQQVKDVVEQFAAPLRGRRGVVDLMTEYTDPIPNATISRVTGIPAKGGEEVRFRELAQADHPRLLRVLDPAAKENGNAAFIELAEWVRKMADERRHSPKDDLITDLVRARDRGDAMNDDEIVNLVTGLIGAGSETTAIGGFVSDPHHARAPRSRGAPAPRARADSERRERDPALRVRRPGRPAALRDSRLRAARQADQEGPDADAVVQRRAPRPVGVPRSRPLRHRARQLRAHDLRARPALLHRRAPRARRDGLHARRRARLPAGERESPPRPSAVEADGLLPAPRESPRRLGA